MVSTKFNKYNDIASKNKNLLSLQPAHKEKTHKLIFNIRASKEILGYFIQWKPFQRIKVGIVGLFEEKVG